MELSKLTKIFQNIINSDGDLPKSVLKILMSPAKDKVLNDYIEKIDSNLQTDELQKIFQYYYADRKEKCQDYTPKSISKLCAELTLTDGNVVYDLCAGSGALTIQKWVQNKDKIFICEELDERVIPFLLFNMAVRNISGYVINRNSLTLENAKCYQLIRREKFSDIAEIETVPNIQADEVISNPPYNIKWEAPAPLFADIRFKEKPIPPSSNANFAFVFTALSNMKQDGRCAFVLPNGVLSNDNEREIRKYLIESGVIERVILLPDKMFEATTIGTCVIVFSFKNKTVKFFDCRKKAMQEQRDQNGQFGGASHENRTYHKAVNILPDDVIVSVSGNCENTPEFSSEIEIQEIANNDFVLVPSRYIQYQEYKNAHRPYADIMADINRISRERSLVKITCNETIAKKIGLYEVAELVKQSDHTDLQATFQILGGKYENRQYITLSKNKNEFKIENQDKDILSSLIKFFLPMWQQHIFYLNQEENRLLAELRDAMLPELMNGEIQI